MSVAYGAGLRVAEVSALKVSYIDSERMLLRIERGKGGRYRNAMLPAVLLPLLREWWRTGRQQGVMHADGCAVRLPMPRHGSRLASGPPFHYPCACSARCSVVCS